MAWLLFWWFFHVLLYWRKVSFNRKNKQELEKPVEANCFKHALPEISTVFITRYRRCEFTVIMFRWDHLPLGYFVNILELFLPLVYIEVKLFQLIIVTQLSKRWLPFSIGDRKYNFFFYYKWPMITLRSGYKCLVQLFKLKQQESTLTTIKGASNDIMSVDKNVRAERKWK